MSGFKKATKYEAKLKLAFVGPAGSGKTYSALAVGCALAEMVGGRVAMIDTERGSGSLYADLFDYDALELQSFSPLAYVEAIRDAEKAGYAVIVVDSLSHAWTGKDGALELKDHFAKREQNNSFAAWRHVTPMHNAMVDTIVSSSSHVIATMRTRTEYVIERDEKTGKSKPRKVGTQPVQRDGLEYEFSVVGDLDADNGFTVTKTRCPLLNSAYIERPGRQLAELLVGWLRGEKRPESPAKPDVTVLLAEMIMEIETAETEDDLMRLVPKLQALPDPPLSEAREHWRVRRAELRQTAAAAKGAEDRPPPSGNDKANEALGRAIEKAGTP